MRWLAGLWLLCAVGVCAQAPKPAANPCDAFANLKPAVGDLPTVSEASRLAKGCSAPGEYYSHDRDRFREARLCAYAEIGLFRDGSKAQRDAAQRFVLAVPDGAEVDPDSMDNAPETLTLAMLYANGEGVPKNTKLAQHFACLSDDWNTPTAIAEELGAGKRFQLCDLEDGASSYGRRTNYICLSIRRGMIDDDVKHAEAMISRSLMPAQRPLWTELLAARKAYLVAHGPEEPNGTTGAVQSAIEEELDDEEAWWSVLKAIALGKPPAGVAQSDDFAKADGQLNVVYQQRLKDDAAYCPAEGNDGGCTRTDQGRVAERAWLKYREAWVRFGFAKWPQIGADKWRGWLTTERIATLGG